MMIGTYGLVMIASGMLIGSAGKADCCSPRFGSRFRRNPEFPKTSIFPSWPLSEMQCTLYPAKRLIGKCGRRNFSSAARGVTMFRSTALIICTAIALSLSSFGRAKPLNPQGQTGDMAMSMPLVAPLFLQGTVMRARLQSSMS
jgi:hypothetical protein